MISLIGWIGAVCFAVSPAPQAYKCYKQGHSHGFSHAMLWLWLVGEVCTIVYVGFTIGFVPVLQLNYAVNLVCLGFIMRYRYFPRKVCKYWGCVGRHAIGCPAVTESRDFCTDCHEYRLAADGSCLVCKAIE